MARKRSPGRPRRKPQTTRRLWRWEVVGLVAIVVGVFAFLSLPPFGRGGGISDLLRRAVGWGAYLASGGLIGVGFLLFLRRREWWGEQKERLWGVAILFLAFLGLVHLLSPALDPLALAKEGGGGGYLGWAISRAFARALGRLGGRLALLIVGGVGLFLIAQVSAFEMRRGVGVAAQTLSSLFRRVVALRLKKIESPPEKGPSAPPRIARPAKPESPPVQTRLPTEKVLPARPRDKRLPSLDFLNESPYPAASEADVERKKHIIEETLASFGVPAKVVSIRQGPTVTQFGVEPGYIDGRREGERQRKVRVSKITSLDKDLALALAGAPIRVEAPVPGRSVVGIEVPNSEVSLVALRGVMESEAFQRAKESFPLTIALGRDVSGQPVIADLALMPHLLIAGATGSGKSVCLSSILTSLLFQNSPARLRFLLVDPKMVELVHFNGLPHLAKPVVREVQKASFALRGVMKEMDRRYQEFAKAGIRNIEHYNSLCEKRGEEPLPYIVVAIDELADLMMVDPDEIERLICRLAQLSRATGIHLIIATQRPSVDVVTGLIKANFPARICFAVSSQVDSRVVLDTAGAETLLGRGDRLYMAPDSSSMVRLQGCFVSDEEIAKVVAFWQREVGISAEQEVIPWEGEVEGEAEVEGKRRDELFEEAKALVMQHERASTSFLQRRLRIGYPRAGRLIDRLEEEGIVGPEESGGRSREVLVREESPKEI
ncbi:MAG: DNA translocase FtsK [Anaerolineae bacterium]|nr:DNA translocase FtsK [Anaerolineae bacterium]